MEDLVYILYLNNKVIGVFDSKSSLDTFIIGCDQNDFFCKKNIYVESFVRNSCLKYESSNHVQVQVHVDKNVSENVIVNVDKKNQNQIDRVKETDDKNRIISILETYKIKNDIKKKKKELEKSEEFLKNTQEKIDLTSKINELKLQKKKIEESHNEYNNDIQLYNKFKKDKDSNINFIIPELFTLKYGIFDKLNNENKINFENFREEYNKVKPKNNYDMFSANPYEESFVHKKEDNDEELIFDIEL
jgi:hypothetical protein